MNHVDPVQKKSQQTAPISNSDDPRTALMNQIKGGVKLKPVNSNQSKPTPVAQSKPAIGLAGALAKALQERKEALQPTDDESQSDHDDDDDEWDEA